MILRAIGTNAIAEYTSETVAFVQSKHRVIVGLTSKEIMRYKRHMERLI